MKIMIRVACDWQNLYAIAPFCDDEGYTRYSTSLGRLLKQWEHLPPQFCNCEWLKLDTKTKLFIFNQYNEEDGEATFDSVDNFLKYYRPPVKKTPNFNDVFHGNS